jgi:hypothetical protein
MKYEALKAIVIYPRRRFLRSNCPSPFTPVWRCHKRVKCLPDSSVNVWTCMSTSGVTTTSGVVDVCRVTPSDDTPLVTGVGVGSWSSSSCSNRWSSFNWKRKDRWEVNSFYTSCSYCQHLAYWRSLELMSIACWHAFLAHVEKIPVRWLYATCIVLVSN